jgi:hypothetical protein
MKVDPGDVRKDTASCAEKQIQISSKREISLGTFTPSLSTKGALSNDCNQFAFWHNGGALPSLSFQPSISNGDVTI